MFLIDTDAISELRRGERADANVLAFFRRFTMESDRCFLSAITLGELRRGAERIRARGDSDQAALLDIWIGTLLGTFGSRVLPIDAEIADLWGRLRVPAHENALDKLIAATALINGLTVVTRNVRDFRPTGVQLLNPFD